MAGLPREVIKWLQSLDLTWQVKTPKWDLTNGYLVAEIFSWYYPQEVIMHMYNNGTSLDSKMQNWSLLKNFFKRQNIDIADDLIEGTIHCKEGAAPLLIGRIYELLTNRQMRQMPTQFEADFTDRAYQVQLPLHARSTAAQAVKNNLRITEIMADKNAILQQQKAQHIINQHVEHRRQERENNPKYFDRKPTLGEMAVRRPPPNSPNRYVNSEQQEADCDSPVQLTDIERVPSREPSVQFKEVQVQQLSRPNQYRTTVSGY